MWLYIDGGGCLKKKAGNYRKIRETARGKCSSGEGGQDLEGEVFAAIFMMNRGRRRKHILHLLIHLNRASANFEAVLRACFLKAALHMRWWVPNSPFFSLITLEVSALESYVQKPLSWVPN